MKYIPKYITTDILAEYGEHLTHEAYNEMVKLNITQGDYNTTILNQLFNTDEGIQIPYLENKIKVVTDAQEIINEDMEHIIEDMIALKGSLNKYTTFCDVRRMMTECSQNFVKINKIKAGDNVEVIVDANKNVIISADSGVSQEYVDTHDASTLNTAKNYTDTKISEIPIPVVPTNISAFNNDVGYITGYTETDPIFGASPAAGIESTDISNWNSKQEELVSGTNIKTINNISLLGSGNIDIQGGGDVEVDPVFTASPAYGISSQDITNWNNKSDFSGNYNDLSGKPTIPSNTSDLNNDSGFITSSAIPTNVSAFNNDAGYLTSFTEVDPVFSASPAAGIQATDITAWNNKSDFSGDYNDLTNKPTIPVIPTNISAFTNDAGYLTSESDPVFTASAAYGITSNDITTWNNKSDFSGNYNDLTNKPTIPTVPTNISAFNNDSGYITGYTETDPVFSASAAAGITAADITRWNNSGGGGAVALEDIAAPYSSYTYYEFNDLCVYNNQIWEANSRGNLNPPDPNDPAEWGQITGHSSVYDHAVDRVLNDLSSKLQYRDVAYDPGAGTALDTGTFLFLYV